MAGLYLGAAAVDLGGAARLMLGAEQIWPGAPSGPSFDAFTLHAWNPDAGANASGIIPDAIGSRPLWIVNPGSGVIANWDGAITARQVLVLDGSDAQAAIGGSSARSISFWRRRNTGSTAFTPVLAYGDNWPGSGGTSQGSFQLSGEDTAGYHLFVDSGAGYGVEDDVTTGYQPADTWEFLTVVMGASGWRIYSGATEIISLAVTFTPPNVNRILTFGPRHIAFDNTQDDRTDDITLSPLILDPWAGRYGDIRLHNKALSGAEIAALYAAGRQSY